MSKVSDNILKRVYLLFGAMALFSVVILVRVVQIQFFQNDKWAKAVEEERVHTKSFPATRGNILAEGGEVLATSQPFYMLPIDPSRIDTLAETFPEQLDSLCKLLSARFGDADQDARWYHDFLMSKIRHKDSRGRRDRHVYLVRHKVDFEDFKVAREWPILRNSKYAGGLILDKKNNTRFYPYDSLARITLGVMEADSIPLKGLEFSFEKYLRGDDGLALVQNLAGGIEMPLEIFQEDQDGADIVTTLNVASQDIVETELRKAVLRHKAKYGVAILMEVETGEIKAVANYPETQNHAMATRIEPGSTFKLASFMAALEDGKISLEDSVDAQGGTYRFFDRTMVDHLGVGKVTYRDAFEQSVNTVTARMTDEGYAKNLDSWFAHLEKFGLTRQVMPQEHIVGENAPKITRPGDPLWSGTTLPWMAIGYNTQLTPLQMLTFYNAVANNGKMVEPILVKRIRRGSKVEHEFKTRVLNSRIAGKRTIEAARSLLEGVVERGTARKIQIGECRLAGKTGTAKKYNKRLGIYENVYQASFCGYFPAEKPKYSLYVMIDEPSGEEYYGASVAGPVFSEIAQQIFTTDIEMVPLFVPPQGRQVSHPVTRVLHQGNAEAVYRGLDVKGPSEAEGTWIRARENEGKLEFSKVELIPGRVPNVYGMSAKDATALLEGLGLKVLLRGHGKVRSQSIMPGDALVSRSRIELVLR